MTCLDPMEELAKKSLAEIDDDFGYYPGYRAAQAKGVLCSGWFTAWPQASSFTTAPHFHPGRRTPAIARFSNFTANPDRHDGALDIRGMATAFLLPDGSRRDGSRMDGSRIDITALRMPRFFLGDAETFVRWQRTTRRTRFDLPRPGLWAIPYAFRGVTPLAGYRQARPLCRVDSYAGCRYNSLHAFRWMNRDSEVQYVRYSWVPEIPEVAMKLWQWRFWRAPHRSDPDFLRTELTERIAQWPVRFRLEVQLAGDGDPVDDARVIWPKNRPTITVGILELTEMGSWEGNRNGSLRFNPVCTVDGIALPEGDTLLMLRKHVYDMSAKRRSEGAQVPATQQLPTLVSPKDPPDLDPDQRVRVNDKDEIDLCFDAPDLAGDRPLLLIMGFACPMTWWHPEFCAMLERKGFSLIRFDNRDCGNSTRVTKEIGRLRSGLKLARAFLHLGAPYTIDDMADDAAGLLEKLGIEQAHVMGISLGGMVAQALAIRHPDRVLSLTSINACPKWRRWPLSRWPSRKILGRIMRRQPTGSRTRWMQYSMPLWRIMSGNNFPEAEEEHVRRLLGLQWAWSGGAHPHGDLRQLLAVIAASDRTPGLKKLNKPAAVIYGSADPFVRPAGGEDTVNAIEGARGVEIHGMGHYTPRHTWPIVVDAVDRVAKQADRAGRPASPTLP